jgi:hypothetical protein
MHAMGYGFELDSENKIEIPMKSTKARRKMPPAGLRVSGLAYS